MKKSSLFSSILFAIIFFIAIYPLSATQISPYALIFTAISIIGFSAVLYRILSKSLTKSNATNLIWIVAISAVPHLLFSLLTYGSWICLGVGIISIVALLVFRKRDAVQ